MDNIGIKLHANFYVVIICRKVFYWSLFIFSCCTMFLFCVRSMCVWWKKWSGIVCQNLRWASDPTILPAMSMLFKFADPFYWVTLHSSYAPGKELHVEQVTFKMNNFHLRWVHLRRDIYLKLGTFLNEYENMLNNYISCIDCILSSK